VAAAEPGDDHPRRRADGARERLAWRRAAFALFAAQQWQQEQTVGVGQRQQHPQAVGAQRAQVRARAGGGVAIVGGGGLSEDEQRAT
jgi:hypothetical protein